MLFGVAEDPFDTSSTSVEFAPLLATPVSVLEVTKDTFFALPSSHSE